MADNPPPNPLPPNQGPRPTLPGSTLTGRLKLTTGQLLPKKPGAGKIVVMLSSVAKAPPAGTQALPRVAPSAPEATAPPSTPVENRVPPLPAKTVVPAKQPPVPSRPQLSTTTYVKLPPKTTTPGWSSLSGKPLVPPTSPSATTPDLPAAPMPAPVSAKTPEPKKPGAHLIPPIKLNEPVTSEPDALADDSIFLQKSTPEPTPSLKPELIKSPVPPTPPVDLKTPTGEMVSLDLFERSQAAPPAPAAPAPAPEAKATPAPLVAPPLIPPQRQAGSVLTTTPMPSVRPPPLPPPGETIMLPTAPTRIAPPMLEKAPEPVAEKLPPPLMAKPVEVVTLPAAPLHIAPPMLEKAPEPVAEKLPPPLMAKPVEVVTPPAAPLHIAPPMLEKAPEPVAEKLPPPLMAKPVEVVTPPAAPLHVAPPMLEKAPEPVAEKLPQPHFPGEARKSAVPPPLPPPTAAAKTPTPAKPDAPPQKSSPPSTPPPAKVGGNWLKQTVPLVVSSSSQKLAGKPIAETKPALKPAVLPSRSQPLPPRVEDPAPPSLEKPDAVVATKPTAKVESKLETQETPVLPVVALPADKPAAESSMAREKSKSKTEPAINYVRFPAGPDVSKSMEEKTSLAPEAKPAPVPLTRAERAKKRRIWSIVTFWVLVLPGTVAALFWASLHFGRDTRVEGQIIPPPGMTLNNEVWIVTDFRSLASGIAEDLAAERTPLLQEIQERQDHVQRAQADVAAREERIRLLQDEIAATKSEIDTVVKQARDDTQKVWDVDGAQIDVEYQARQDQLQSAIAGRAKSLKLNYQPDDTFHSPEVWANAYRLALYQVPAGVDTAKEHAWLADLMKGWRDFQKTMDDRTEQLREKAAQIKLGPAPKINDLNAKIDDFQQRVDATQADEVPLKAEVQQAQADLVTVQTAEAQLDDKYYKQLDSLPSEAITKHIPLRANGRFTWIEDDVFVEGETSHHYWIFSCATRPDGRQYWALHHFEIGKNQTMEMSIEPPGFISTKAILRPNLSPDEQAQ